MGEVGGQSSRSRATPTHQPTQTSVELASTSVDSSTEVAFVATTGAVRTDSPTETHGGVGLIDSQGRYRQIELVGMSTDAVEHQMQIAAVQLG